MTPRLFYGWYVLAAVFVLLAATSGLVFYALTVFLRALTLEQGFTVSAVSGASAVFFLVSGLASLPVAALLARFDARVVLVPGALVAAAALASLGAVTAVWQLYLAYAALGLGYCAAGLVPGTTLVTRWFHRRRALALALASTGLSVGGIALTPALARHVEDRGLGTVAPWLALAFAAATVPVALLVVRSDPAGYGLAPDGGAAAPSAAPAPTREEAGGAGAAGGPTGTAVGEAQRTRFFWAATGAYLLAMLGQVGALGHLYNLAAERLGSGAAAASVSVVALASLVGRLLGGVLLLRVPLRAFTVANLVLAALSLAALGLGTGRGAVLGATAAFGLTVGNIVMLHPLLLADAFGVRDYARVYSRSTVLATAGIAAGPAVLGMLHDRLDGYAVAFLAAAASSAFGAALLLSPAGRRPVPPAVQPV